jgi:hypothetical protein
MKYARFISLIAIFAFSIIANFALTHSNSIARVAIAAADEAVLFLMDEGDIAFTVISGSVEATSTAEMFADVGFDDKVEYTVSDARVFRLGYNSNTLVTDLDYVSPLTRVSNKAIDHKDILNSVVLGANRKINYAALRTDNKLKGGAAFVGGGLPYRV